MNPDGRTNPASHTFEPTAASPKGLSPASVLAIAWLFALFAVAAVRYRGEWNSYAALHRWCADQGIPDWVRNFDSLFLFSAAAFAGAGAVAWRCGGSALALLRVRSGRPGWVRMVLIALIPMVVGGAVLGAVRWTPDTPLTAFPSKVVSGVVRAPIAEELLFRGLLVGVCAPAVGWRGVKFWCNASLAALLFGLLHVSWSLQGVTTGWPALLMTGAGGLWYAWLLARWGSLWIPMALHAGMNLGWLLAGASGGAGGGGWLENMLRVGTISVATWWTIRRCAGAITAD